MTVRQAQQQLRFQLNHIYSDQEASNIADWVLEHITGLPKIDRVKNQSLPLLASQLSQLENIQEQLLTHKPIQYVLNESWFYGMKLFVDENVLIPRPETEELVDWIVKEAKSTGQSELTILDIGTGSGCIPLAIKRLLPHCEVYALDISEGALTVARKNAQIQDLAVHFMQVDILNVDKSVRFPRFDIIVSNPPYISLHEKSAMADNVLKYEPWLALFVENEDPLKFYKAITEFSLINQPANGLLYFECNELYAYDISEFLKKQNCSETEIKTDMQGKQRFVRAKK